MENRLSRFQCICSCVWVWYILNSHNVKIQIKCRHMQHFDRCVSLKLVLVRIHVRYATDSCNFITQFCNRCHCCSTHAFYITIGWLDIAMHKSTPCKHTMCCDDHFWCCRCWLLCVIKPRILNDFNLYPSVGVAMAQVFATNANDWQLKWFDWHL